jgi:hypothetical protein
MRSIEDLKKIFENEVNRLSHLDSRGFGLDITNTHDNIRKLYDISVYIGIALVNLIENELITVPEAELLLEIYEENL